MQILSMYLYLGDIWFSDDILEHITPFTTNAKNLHLVVLLIS